ncbi:MAG: hypothetical protein U1F07_04995 [Rubrivivax sp.]
MRARRPLLAAAVVAALSSLSMAASAQPTARTAAAASAAAGLAKAPITLGAPGDWMEYDDLTFTPAAMPASAAFNVSETSIALGAPGDWTEYDDLTFVPGAAEVGAHRPAARAARGSEDMAGAAVQASAGASARSAAFKAPVPRDAPGDWTEYDDL